ncbi:hypothetical protein [Corynebacterium glyciniphilum]|uniref:hypothetical protein n=1 Tax=Corynebacterium glyciniphilum TaxID=1404244 RepID=UPI001642F593|nr:hypothetical protein [Corynebacterium glyciniphilum]
MTGVGHRGRGVRTAEVVTLPPAGESSGHLIIRRRRPTSEVLSIASSDAPQDQVHLA